MCYGTSYADAFKDKILSVDFENTSVSDALHKLSIVVGAEITIEEEMDAEFITKSYKDVTIEEILLDIFAGKNIVALFRYRDQELVSIQLWALSHGAGNMEIIKQQITNNQNINVDESAQRSFTEKKVLDSLFQARM